MNFSIPNFAKVEWCSSSSKCFSTPFKSDGGHESEYHQKCSISSLKPTYIVVIVNMSKRSSISTADVPKHEGKKTQDLVFNRWLCFASRLDLRWNNVGLLGGRALLNCLHSNRALRQLELAGNNVPSDILKAVGEQLCQPLCASRSQFSCCFGLHQTQLKGGGIKSQPLKGD